MKLSILLIALVCAGLTGFTMVTNTEGPASPAYQQAAENVAFQWAFGAMVGSGKKSSFVSVTRDTVLKSGDEIKMFVQLTKECYVYVIYAGTKGELSLLFPYDLKQFSSDYEVGKNYYIPKGRTWNILDKTAGRETFYVLGSSERLLDLEAKLGDYVSTKDDAKKDNLSKDIVAEIRNVKKRFKNFATIAEKPLTIGGNVRSLEKQQEVKKPDVSTVATQISANNFYSKTFTIDHQ